MQARSTVWLAAWWFGCVIGWPVIAPFPARAQSPPAKRVALVIGQDGYRAEQGGLVPLANPGRDARRMAALLAAHGFDVISCDGARPACFDLTQAAFKQALETLRERAREADTALVFYAGHGLETHDGNILAAVDSRIDCQSWGVSAGVLLDDVLQAIEPHARTQRHRQGCDHVPEVEFSEHEAGEAVGYPGRDAFYQLR